ncbi:hypothetical protein GQ597_07565 [Gilliamella sp. Pra-s65]|uniref:hypothetical protein n=1 Tax=unclassified Gilliamella TaxID=2685620 RepID=UPI00132A1662|nr:MULTISPECIES: hypothetical protein [unclassified Gilliamella]MWN32480.1 hypothetical protein [Gilliamella sp. Pra-s60]MWN90553.1 hypothetical protein [Gilliamella sp. Pra-s65]MWP29958.1 hypothetical protein [Gilliamella sp. Pra-s54]MWP46117.1 hypothetical protein [Gilliamella sp. Pas-s27]MWP73568.1 hypothetical protein [Gilliamella sp. Pra-s52]
MKSAIIGLSCLMFSVILVGCGGKNDEGKTYHWSKAHGVLEDCRGVMNKSQQCEANSNNQQYLIKIDKY